jgi:hypothetical protein
MTREIASRACADLATPRITGRPGSDDPEREVGFSRDGQEGQRLLQVELDVVGGVAEVRR